MSEPSVTDVPGALELLDEYCAGENPFAWPLYDEDPSPGTLCGADLTAPALLSYPIQGKFLNQMGKVGTEYHEMVAALSDFVFTEGGMKFSELDEAALIALGDRDAGSPLVGPLELQKLEACLDAVGRCKGLTSVAVTKILHRKRPDFVPINDSRVRTFYRVADNYAQLFLAIHRDLVRAETREFLKRLVSGRATPDGRVMTELRALDIVIWMHMDPDRT